MKRVAFVALLMLCWQLLVSCTRTVYMPVGQRRSEEVVVRDTIVEVVTVGEKLCNKTSDTASVLRSDRAYSVATVSEGVLSHSLTVFPRRDSITLQWREVHTTDSVPYLVPVAGERVEVVPAWLWWVVAALVVWVLFLSLLLRRRA